MVEDDSSELNISDYMYLVGKMHVFEDGDSIEIIQIKRRDSGPWVTFHIKQGPGIPRKLLLSLEEFSSTYGHLFKQN
jgi:hypothetical protein